MKGLSNCRTVQPLHWFNSSNICLTIIVGALLCPRFGHSQNFSPDKKFARSISGQFIVYAAPHFSTLARSASVAVDTNFVRLEPALLVVSAERIKDSLWRRL